MLNPSQAWARCKTLAQFKGKKLSDFRPMVYTQNVALAATSQAGPTPVQFPGGAIILGICASAIASTPAAIGAPGRVRSGIQLSMAYTNGENVVPTLTNVDALMGGGDGTQFPARELIVMPNQNLNLTLNNLTTTALSVDVAFHCLVPREMQ
jgi:hypothetical protein